MEFFDNPPYMELPVAGLAMMSFALTGYYGFRLLPRPLAILLPTTMVVVFAGYDMSRIKEGAGSLSPSAWVGTLAFLLAASAYGIVACALLPEWKRPHFWTTATLASAALMACSEYGRTAGMDNWGSSVAVFSITTLVMGVITLLVALYTKKLQRSRLHA